MKTCSLCEISKSELEFDKNKSKKDGLQSQCKNCRQLASKKYYSENTKAQKGRVYARKNKIRDYVIEYLKKHPCVDCGISNVVVLEFDHLRDKKYNITDMVRYQYKIENIQAEIDKCEVRCANCHRIKTAKQFGNYKIRFGGIEQ